MMNSNTRDLTDTVRTVYFKHGLDVKAEDIIVDVVTSVTIVGSVENPMISIKTQRGANLCIDYHREIISPIAGGPIAYAKQAMHIPVWGIPFIRSSSMPLDTEVCRLSKIVH